MMNIAALDGEFCSHSEYDEYGEYGNIVEDYEYGVKDSEYDEYGGFATTCGELFPPSLC